MFKKIITLLCIILLMMSLVGCSNKGVQITEPNLDNGKLVIITSLFPQYDFTKRVAGPYAEVTLILPPGIEAHAFEPTPNQIVKIMDSDIFIYTNAVMEPWAHRLTENIDADKTLIVDLSENIELIKSGDSEGDDHLEGEYDPHYWLDPLNAVIMVDSIVDALSQTDEENSAYYADQGETLKNELLTLDESIKSDLQKTTSKTILSGGHFAFGYFIKRYGLSEMSPYVGFSPDAEPTPKRISEMIKTIEETNAKAIFYEELIDPRVAKVIADETGVAMLLLHGAHNMSKDELEQGITYIEIMKGNLERLKIGLGYHE